MNKQALIKTLIGNLHTAAQDMSEPCDIRPLTWKPENFNVIRERCPNYSTAWFWGLYDLAQCVWDDYEGECEDEDFIAYVGQELGAWKINKKFQKYEPDCVQATEESFKVATFDDYISQQLVA
jgi:hypothetical protein